MYLTIKIQEILITFVIAGTNSGHLSNLLHNLSEFAFFVTISLE